MKAQFVREYIPLSFSAAKRKRTRLYKLSDPFLIFYFKYIHNNRKLISLNKQNENLYKAITGPSIHQYYGFVFERLGEDSIMDIIKALNLKLVDIVSMGPYFQQPRGGMLGAQIDWLIIRRDNVLTIMEFKYHKNPPGTEIIKQVKQKIDRLPVPGEFTVEPVLVTSIEPKKAVVESGFFTHILTLKDFL